MKSQEKNVTKFIPHLSEGVFFKEIMINAIKPFIDYLQALLMYDFSWFKCFIIGFSVFIFFELIFGWYIPKDNK